MLGLFILSEQCVMFGLIALLERAGTAILVTVYNTQKYLDSGGVFYI